MLVKASYKSKAQKYDTNTGYLQGYNPRNHIA